jgi:hypothetical protein
MTIMTLLRSRPKTVAAALSAFQQVVTDLQEIVRTEDGIIERNQAEIAQLQYELEKSNEERQAALKAIVNIKTTFGLE